MTAFAATTSFMPWSAMPCKNIEGACRLLAKQYKAFACLGSENNPVKPLHGGFRLLLAAGNQLKEWKQVQDSKEWKFGVIPYEELHTLHGIPLARKALLSAEPNSFFFPDWVAEWSREGMRLLHGEFPNSLFQQTPPHDNTQPFQSTILESISKKEYLENFSEIHQNIIDGDYYEINYCVPYMAKVPKSSDVVGAYFQTHEQNSTPFSGLLKLGDRYLCSLSPERFLKKEGRKLVSQPIKGTIGRGVDKKEDEKLKQLLLNNEKELAENRMIVDLVRNDLARLCENGSVTVEELFGLYSFPMVHQLISTVAGTMDKDRPWKEVLHALFPMGSMTGAPKLAVMDKIAALEPYQRQWFSGAMGYFSPDGNADLNVTIRSLTIDVEEEIAVWHAGGAITFDSKAEQEYQEMLLKASSAKQMLHKLGSIKN